MVTLSGVKTIFVVLTETGNFKRELGIIVSLILHFYFS